MVNYTLGDLIHDSFRVTHGMIAVFPQTGHEVTLSVDFFIAKFNGHYSANNSTTIGFICQNRYTMCLRTLHEPLLRLLKMAS